MSRPCPNKVGLHGPQCRLEMAHLGACLPPRWNRFLDELVGDDAELRGYLRRATPGVRA